MRLLLGIWLVQMVTAGLTVLALRSDAAGLWPLVVGLALASGAIAAVALGALLSGERKLGEAELRRRHAEERATLTLDAERQRARDAERLSAARAQARDQRSGRLKAGALAGGVAGIGVTLLLAQVFVLGFAVIAFVAGGAGGYAVRGWRLRRGRPPAGEAPLAPRPGPKQIGGDG
jgi:hypothetical protein